MTTTTTTHARTWRRIPWTVVTAMAVVFGCRSESRLAHTSPSNERSRSPETTQRVARFCGDCHAMPKPSSFPRSAWHKEVTRGFNFYFESGRQDLELPDRAGTIQYFVERAPEELNVSVPTAVDKPSSPSLEFRRTVSPSSSIELPGVSFLEWLTLPGRENPSVLISDMRSGDLLAVDLADGEFKPMRLATLQNPARCVATDLDQDGKSEFVVADLASFTSGDHRRGSVVWLRREAHSDRWEQVLLFSGVGRVADVQPCDLDGDGDQDLLVAEFGHFKTGGIHWLELEGWKNGWPLFRPHRIDSRAGTMRVIAANLNNDQRLDFIAVISQEHEVIDAFLNEGAGQFSKRRVFDGGDPAYGSASLELIDLDKDGDQDLLYANGDTYGSNELKPYHAIHWLENQGELKFVDHRIASMVGVQAARCVDLDGDRDLDVVACAMMPSNLVLDVRLKDHDSLLWLEQVSPGTFERHVLEKNAFHHAAILPADLDADGDVDLAVGNLQDTGASLLPRFSVWWNEGRPSHAK